MKTVLNMLLTHKLLVAGRIAVLFEFTYFTSFPLQFFT